MDSDRESERQFSLRLSHMMDGIGVNSFVIARRRRSHQRRETMNNVYNLLKEVNETSYIIGSQSEATLTPGMESDTDLLYCDNSAHVTLDWCHWQYGKPNILVLKNELTPPQHCYLQRLRGDYPLPAEETVGPDDVQVGEGEVIVANTWIEQQEWIRKLSKSGEIIRHGPSMSYDEKYDSVRAYHCHQLPDECKFMFNRPRPGHWPRPETLARARKTGVFLVPQGYTERPEQLTCRSKAFMVPSILKSYPFSKWQWRFSTSLMERLLMFDFSPVQVKVYTLTKIMRKTFLKPVFGDRFSIFHIKTAMMFTIENYPSEIWREDNLVQCVFLLLATLKRWLKQKYCPHFTISRANIFVGKLHNWELPKLCHLVSIIFTTDMHCLFYTRMDNINLRLLQCQIHDFIPCQNISTEAQTSRNIIQDMIHDEISGFNFHLDNLMNCQSVDDIFSHLFILQGMSDSQSDLEQDVVARLIPFLCSTVASILASRCIFFGLPITQYVFNWYQLSLDSDRISSRLKFASMLYCRGHYEEAEKVLTYCEGLLGPEVWQFCKHYGRKFREPSAEFRNNLMICPTTEVHTKYTMVCITFTAKEIYCMPHHLVYEMFKIIKDEDRHHEDRWYNAVIDCIPFLYYLQHLTYTELHQPIRAQTALHNLYEYATVTPQGHIDTTFNMLGHCFELQNRLDIAWICYYNRPEIFGRDNISNWHAARILYKFLHS